MTEFSNLIMGHDGKDVTELLDELGIKKGILAEKLDKSPNTITTLLRKQTISNEMLINIGKAIRFDLTSRFPRLRQVPERSQLNYFNSDPHELLNKVEEVQAVYQKKEQTVADQKLEIEFLKRALAQQEELLAAKNQIIQGLQIQINSLERRLSEKKGQ